MSPVRVIPLAGIPESTRLSYRDPLGDQDGAAALRRSIQRAGVVEPVLLRDGDLEPVHGFRRLEACRALGVGEVPARLERRSLTELFVQAVEANTAQAAPTLRERSVAMAVAGELGMSTLEITDAVLPALGLEPHAALLERHLALLDMAPELLSLLSRKGFSLRRATPLGAFTEEEGSMLARALAGLGARRIEEAALMLREVCARDRVSLADLALELELPAGDAAALERLRARRYPETAALRRQVEARCQELAGDAARLAFDPNFAAPGLELRAALRSPRDLERLLDTLSGPRAQELLREILGALGGPE